MVTSTPRAGSRIVGGYIKGESAKAILIEVHQLDGADVEPEQQKDHWFPLSQVSSIYRNRGSDGGYDTLTASNWICQQKELV